MPRFPELEQPLSDGVVAVRLGAERDIPEVLIAYQDDPVLHLRMGERAPPSGAELGRRAELAEDDRNSGQRLTLTVLEHGSDVCVGQIHVDQVEWEHARAELAVWIAPQLRRRGMARRALALAGRWLLEQCGLERVGLLVESANEPLIRAALAAGFHKEGVLRGYRRALGSRVDVVALSLVRRDLAF